jgi:hypothetical protein
VFQTDPENVAHVALVAAHQVEAAVGVVNASGWAPAERDGSSKNTALNPAS